VWMDVDDISWLLTLHNEIVGNTFSVTTVAD
jgi:hypothetical protein